MGCLHGLNEELDWCQYLLGLIQPVALVRYYNSEDVVSVLLLCCLERIFE